MISVRLRRLLRSSMGMGRKRAAVDLNFLCEKKGVFRRHVWSRWKKAAPDRSMAGQGESSIFPLLVTWAYG